jgi:hypothetical protein
MYDRETLISGRHGSRLTETLAVGIVVIYAAAIVGCTRAPEASDPADAGVENQDIDGGVEGQLDDAADDQQDGARALSDSEGDNAVANDVNGVNDPNDTSHEPDEGPEPYVEIETPDTIIEDVPEPAIEPWLGHCGTALPTDAGESHKAACDVISKCRAALDAGEKDAPCAGGGKCQDGYCVKDGMVLVPPTHFYMGLEATEWWECNKIQESEIYKLTPAPFVPRLVSVSAHWIDLTEVVEKEVHHCVVEGGCGQLPLADWGYSNWDTERGPSGFFDTDWGSDPAGAMTPPMLAETVCAERDARLPTEAEWEVSARGGCETVDSPCREHMRRFPWGSDDSVLDVPSIGRADFPVYRSVYGCDGMAVGYVREPAIAGSGLGPKAGSIDPAKGLNVATALVVYKGPSGLDVIHALSGIFDYTGVLASGCRRHASQLGTPAAKFDTDFLSGSYGLRCARSFSDSDVDP